MKETKFIFKIILVAIITNLMLLAGFSKAQQLSEDPLYVLQFEDDFASFDANKWRTSWYWGNNMWNSNFTRLCDTIYFPGRIVDVAYNSQPPNDDNRMFIDSGGITYERLIFDREDIYGNIIAYHSPCPSALCINHACDTNIWNTSYCYYDSLVPFKFSGAMLLGKEKFKYGYIEMRYKLRDLQQSPYNAYGPNLWMWASDTSARYSEIDIFEQQGTKWHMAMNFHFRKYNPDSSNVWKDTVFWHGVGKQVTISSPYPSILDESLEYNGGTWHTVGCEWTPDYIDTYYDSDDTIRRFSVSKIPVDRLIAMPLIIDLYMPAAQYCIPFDSIKTYRPFNYDIDYIRVYQINQDSNCASTSGYFPSFATNNYTSRLYRDLTIGGGGSAILNNGSFHLAGQDFVLLQSGFEASGIADVIISTTPCQTDQTRVTNSTRSAYEMPDRSTMRDILEAKTHE